MKNHNISIKIRIYKWTLIKIKIITIYKSFSKINKTNRINIHNLQILLFNKTTNSKISHTLNKYKKNNPLMIHWIQINIWLLTTTKTNNLINMRFIKIIFKTNNITNHHNYHQISYKRLKNINLNNIKIKQVFQGINIIKNNNLFHKTIPSQINRAIKQIESVPVFSLICKVTYLISQNKVKIIKTQNLALFNNNKKIRTIMTLMKKKCKNSITYIIKCQTHPNQTIIKKIHLMIKVKILVQFKILTIHIRMILVPKIWLYLTNHIL